MLKAGSLCLGLLCALSAWGADDKPRFLKQTLPGKSTTVVVAEGEREPRSIGSYSLRIYGAANAKAPYDDFIAGVIQPRDGNLEGIRFADLDHDGSPEIVVLVRSAGTGGYLSADAFRLRGTTLSLLASVSDLSKDADAIHALQEKIVQSRNLPSEGKKSSAK